MRKQTAFVAALLSGSLLVSGCSQEKSEGIPEKTKQAVLTLAVSDPDITAALVKVENDCARAAGVPHRAYPQTYDFSSLTATDSIFSDPAVAAQRGYPQTRDTESQMPQENLTAAQQKIISGSEDQKKMATVNIEGGSQVAAPKDGCIGKARAAVYGSVENALRVENFPNQILRIANKDDSVGAFRMFRKFSSEYERCMQESGYTVSAGKAGEYAKRKWGAYRKAEQGPSADEAALARTDAECQSKIGLTSAVRDDFFENGASWATENEGSILKLAEIRAESEKRAQKILTGK